MVKPILKENCVNCHNSKDKQGNLNFDNFEELMNSRYLNRNYSVVIEKKPEESRLYLVINSNNLDIKNILK